MQSTFGGMEEEGVNCLAVHFQYLPQVLDAYGFKPNHFVQSLQLSDTGVSGKILPERNVTLESYLISLPLPQ